MRELSINCENRGLESVFTCTNTSIEDKRIQEICVFETRHEYEPGYPIYAEGFQMLSQYEGTVARPQCITAFSDAGHYRLPKAEGCHTAYNLLLVRLPDASCDLYAFSSCFRFNGKILWNHRKLKMVLDLEGRVVKAGETLELERVCVMRGVKSGEALEALGGLLRQNHPVRLPARRPAGWCSWYCFGEEVTGQNILDNVKVIAEQLPGLSHIQIDDGYETHMGDWLEVSESFGDLRGLLRGIEQSGCKPAIWVAPFIAEKDSRLLREHPEYFVQAETGGPLASDAFTFGGWRNGPWYMLDGTHPGARAYLRQVFTTMRRKWNIRYFKLDANCWGAFPHGVRYDPNATSVEAYRLGMQAVWEGAGEDALILGCNAPMWPSIGAVNAMRISGDLLRDWPTVKNLYREILHRSWMHNVLWVNDPDVFTLQNQRRAQLMPDGTLRTQTVGTLSEAELRFHKTLVYASGGMMLCGDDMTRYGEAQLREAAGFLQAPFAAPQVDCFDLRRVTAGDFLCIFNDGDEEMPVSPGKTLGPHDAAMIKIR